MNSVLKNKKYLFLCFCFVVFLFFLFISRWAPVAGDDWGYAVGGRYADNVFLKAWEFYLGWSGRYFSELWGFLVAPHKHLWNVLNALLFTMIFYFLIKHVEPKHLLLTSFLCFSLMLSVPNGLRMQTYTWIMGTTYVIPLCMFLYYLFFIRKFFFHTYDKWMFILACIFNFMIPLYMENAAAMLAGGNVLLCIYAYFQEKKIKKELIILLCISIIGVLLVRFSPGAVFRMARDHAAFNSLSLFAKIQTNWLPFIRFTFTNNIWLMRALAIIVLILACMKKERNQIERILFICSSLLVLIQTYSWELFDLTKINYFYILNDLNMPHSLTINTIIYFLFTAVLFYVAYFYVENKEKKWFLIFLLFLAGGANLVMLISPIFDVRSSLYTVYLFLLFVLLLGEEIELKEKAAYGLLGVFVITSCVLVWQYAKLYHMIHLVDIKRSEQIEYYRLRPDTKEAYILGFPSQSVHSADIQEGDDYHMQYFKEYYYLDQNIHLNFYYLDNYTREEIQAE